MSAKLSDLAIVTKMHSKFETTTSTVVSYDEHLYMNSHTQGNNNFSTVSVILWVKP